MTTITAHKYSHIVPMTLEASGLLNEWRYWYGEHVAEFLRTAALTSPHFALATGDGWVNYL